MAKIRAKETQSSIENAILERLLETQSAFYVNLYRAVIGPSG